MSISSMVWHIKCCVLPLKKSNAFINSVPFIVCCNNTQRFRRSILFWLYNTIHANRAAKILDHLRSVNLSKLDLSLCVD